MSRGIMTITEGEFMEIIQQIIAMDKAAAAKVQQAEEARRKELDESGENAARVREQKLTQGRERLEARRKELDAKLSEKRGAAGEQLDARIKELDSAFGAGREQWKSEIMKRITGV